jgi:hypothetical protein
MTLHIQSGRAGVVIGQEIMWALRAQVQILPTTIICLLFFNLKVVLPDAKSN